MLIKCTILLAVFCGLTKSDESTTPTTPTNYVATALLPDGEQEVRMRFGNVIVRETFVTQADLHEKGVRRGLMLRQVGEGPRFLQLIYKLNYQSESGFKHRKLVECEVIHDFKTANQFRTQFLNDLRNSGLLHLNVPTSPPHHHEDDQDDEGDDNGDEDDDNVIMTSSSSDVDSLTLDQGMDEFRNVTVRIFSKDEEISPSLKKAFDLRAQQKQCKRLHKRMKQVAKAKAAAANDKHDDSASLSSDRSQRNRREAFRVGIMPGTLWCGDGSLADKYESMGAHVGTDRCCREHDGCPYLIDAMSSKYEMFNYRMHTISHCTCDERNMTTTTRWKRDLVSPLQLPGTQWCGRGYSATEMTQLGGLTGTDNCCRYHDLGCPFYIEAFQEKFNLFNWRMYTINHCTCDERFRSCLKQTNTGSSNFVGKIFFNVVQTKCFLLKPERFCAKMSWFGKCLKYEHKKQAHLRDPIPY